jgi:hypothetical protein
MKAERKKTRKKKRTDFLAPPFLFLSFLLEPFFSIDEFVIRTQLRSQPLSLFFL